jgi:hypothetical protein
MSGLYLKLRTLFFSGVEFNKCFRVLFIGLQHQFLCFYMCTVFQKIVSFQPHECLIDLCPSTAKKRPSALSRSSLEDPFIYETLPPGRFISSTDRSVLYCSKHSFSGNLKRLPVGWRQKFQVSCNCDWNIDCDGKPWSLV